MFRSARLKLTAWYLLIIMCISIAFSVVIYQGLSREVERFARIQEVRNERRLRLQLPSDSLQPLIPSTPSSLELDVDLILETRQRILFALIFINATILIIAGGLGYILAGKTLRPIQQMVDEQNRFVSDASHELRTPLTSLKAAFEVYLRSQKPDLPEAKTLIQESIGEVNRLQSLSESLLQLTQYQTLSENIPFKSASLKTIIDNAVHKVEPMAKQNKITIKTDVPNLRLEANAYGLTDSFVILLDNAVKYSAPNKTIIIHAKRTDGKIILSFIDQGIGISEKDIPHIFDRFYRADSARTKKDSGGYGLGLSIAKKIISMHHGSIEVKSILKKGSTFIVQLPIKH